MTERLQELRRKYTEAYMRLFKYIKDRDPLMLREFIATDELYQGEQE
jgi:hypothetical protein